MNKILFRAILVTVLFTAEALAQFEGGSGTVQDPYKVATLQQLQEIKNHPEKHFIQIADIEAGETVKWNSGSGFVPVGNIVHKFTGSYNGNGYKISNLYIRRPDEDYIGLFGYLKRGVIENLFLEAIQIEGSDNTGAIAGFSINGRIKNSRVTGLVHGKTHVGGLIGFNFGEIAHSSFNGTTSGHSYIGGLVGFNRGKISSSNTTGEITGKGNGIGGLVGNNYDGEISTSFTDVNVIGSQASSFGALVGSNGGEIHKVHARGEVSGRSYVGGIAGFNRGIITEANADVQVTGYRNGAGGLVGNNYQGKVTKAFSSGNVTGKTQVGGLIGVNRVGASVSEVYSVSEVKGGNDTGGLIGLNETPVEYSYWNKELSMQQEGTGRGPTEGMQALGTREMLGSSAVEHMPGFSFNETWGTVPDEFPKLLWDIPYFIIENIEGKNAIISGDALDLSISVKNIGGIADTNHVVLRNAEGEVIYTTENLILQSKEVINLELGWKSTTEDNGEFEFQLQTQFDREVVQFSVRRIPDQVETTSPDDLDENVAIQPKFNWKETYLAEQYQLQIASDAALEEILIHKKDIEALSYRMQKPLKHLNTYFWRVRGVNTEENGPWSNVLSFTTIIEKPETVILSEPENESGLTSTFPMLYWSTSQRADEYKLQLAIEDEFEEVIFDTTFSAPDTTYEFEEELQEQKEFYWRVQAVNEGGTSDWSETGTFKTMKSLSPENEQVPLNFALKQNYPNPFNNSTVIQYGIPKTTHVLLEVLNMLGQNVATLVNEPKSAGWHSVVFNASELSSGFYLYRIKTRDFERTKKLMLIK